MRLSSVLVRLLVIITSPAAAIALGAACSSSSSSSQTPGSASVEDAAADVTPELEPVEPADAGSATCTLTAKMGTGVAACDECLQKACCQTLVACLGEATCTALNGCMNDCAEQYGRTDAGAQCVRACAQGKDEPAKRLADALECQSTRCGTQCS